MNVEDELKELHIWEITFLMGNIIGSSYSKTVLTTDKSYAQAEKVGLAVAEDIRAHSGKYWDGTLSEVKYVGLSNIILGDLT